MSGFNVKLSSSECPYSVLVLLEGAPATEVSLHIVPSQTAKYDPDKRYGSDASDADVQFKRVTNAYEQVKRAGLAAEGGVGGYASLGRTARSGLSEPVSMNSSNMSNGIPDGMKVAVRQLDPDIVTPFLTRLYAPSGVTSH